MDKKVGHRQLDKFHGFFPARGARYLRDSKYLTADDYSSVCTVMGVKKFHEGYKHAVKLDRQHFKSAINSTANVSTAKSFFEFFLNFILAHPNAFKSPDQWPMKQVIYVAESILALIFHYHTNKISANTKLKFVHDVEQTMKKVNKAKSLYAAIKIIRDKYEIPEPLDTMVEPVEYSENDHNSNNAALSTTDVQNGLIKGDVGDTSESIDTNITSPSTQTPTQDSENVTVTVKQSIADTSSINIDTNITPPVPSPFSTSFSTEVIQESSVSSVKSELEENDDCIVINEPPTKKPKIKYNIDSNITPPVSSPTLTPFSSVKRELEESNDCMVVVEPPTKKPKIENNETFAFEHPSTSILKEICKKLNLEYSHDAYKFWANIGFQNILSTSKNIRSHSFKSKNIFACLSQFFTGKTKSCFLFQHAINSALFDDLNASGTMPLEEIEKICTSNTAFDEHFEFIAKYLSCRIGIYENGILRKFGKWENNDNALTLVLLLEGELYTVVLDI